MNIQIQSAQSDEAIESKTRNAKEQTKRATKKEMVNIRGNLV